MSLKSPETDSFCARCNCGDQCERYGDCFPDKIGNLLKHGKKTSWIALRLLSNAFRTLALLHTDLLVSVI